MRMERVTIDVNGRHSVAAFIPVGRWAGWLAAFAVAAALLWWAGLGLSQYLTSSSSDKLSDKEIPIAGTTLYDAGEQLSFIRVFEREEATSAGGGGERVLQTVINDLNSGQRLGVPQEFRFPLNSHSDWAQFRRYANGDLFLLLQKSRLLQFNPQVQQFVDLTPSVSALIPSGIESMEHQGPEWPDALRVRAQNGQTYYVNWPARQILEQSKAVQAYAQAASSYTQDSQGYGFAPMAKEHSNGGVDSPQAAYLVRYVNKGVSGQMVYRPEPSLYRWNRGSRGTKSDALQPIAEGLAWRAQDATTPGLLAVEAATPVQPRTHGEVLATNPSHVLVTFDSQGLQNGGGYAQVLQLIDRETLKVVWTQALARIPQLAARIGGVQLQADGVRGGFYLRNGYVAPVLYIDNAGQTLYDFTAGRGSTGPHPGSHPGEPR